MHHQSRQHSLSIITYLLTTLSSYLLLHTIDSLTWNFSIYFEIVQHNCEKKHLGYISPHWLVSFYLKLLCYIIQILIFGLYTKFRILIFSLCPSVHLSNLIIVCYCWLLIWQSIIIIINIRRNISVKICPVKISLSKIYLVKTLR